MTDLQHSVLRLLAASDRPLTVREMSDALGVSAFRLGNPLAQIADSGLLLRHAGTKRRYELTFRGRRVLALSAPRVEAPGHG